MAEVKLEEPEHLRRLRVGIETKAKEMKRQTAIDAALTMLGFVGMPAAISRQAASRGIVRGALEHIPSRKAALKWAKTHVRGAARTPEELLDEVRAVKVEPLTPGRYAQVEELIRPSTGQIAARDVTLSSAAPAKPTSWPHEVWWHINQMLRREAGEPSARALMGGTKEATAMAPAKLAPAAELHAHIGGKRAAEALARTRPSKIFTSEEVKKMYEGTLREALATLGTKY